MYLCYLFLIILGNINNISKETPIYYVLKSPINYDVTQTKNNNVEYNSSRSETWLYVSMKVLFYQQQYNFQNILHYAYMDNNVQVNNVREDSIVIIK